MRMTHVRLLVDDYPACFRFYQEVMGFKALWGDENSGYANFIPSWGDQKDTLGGLALFGRQAMAEAVGAAALPADVDCQDRAMLIFVVEDLEDTVAQLKARGARFVVEIEAHPGWGTCTAHLRDPAGTLIELGSQMPKSEWTQELREADERF